MLLAALHEIAADPNAFLTALERHLLLCALAIGFAGGIGLPLAVLVTGRETAAAIAIGLVHAIRTIPSLAILSAMLPILGIGLWPSVVALIVLALPPILLNAFVGLRDTDRDAMDAARGIGMRRAQILWRVQLPLATPAIFAGLRTAAVQVLSGATLAAFIGGGGLGDFITGGIALMDMPRLLVGAVPIALLAIATEYGLGWLERRAFRRRSAA